MILSHTHLSWKKPKGSSPVSVPWAQGLHQIRSLRRNIWWGPSIEVVTTSTVRFSGCINTILIRYRTETPQTPEWGQRHSTRRKWQGQKICRFAMQNPLAPAENAYCCSLHGEACLLPSHMPILPNQYQSTWSMSGRNFATPYIPRQISWSLSSLWLRCDSSKSNIQSDRIFRPEIPKIYGGSPTFWTFYVLEYHHNMWMHWCICLKVCMSVGGCVRYILVEYIKMMCPSVQLPTEQLNYINNQVILTSSGSAQGRLAYLPTMAPWRSTKGSTRGTQGIDRNGKLKCYGDGENVISISLQAPRWIVASCSTWLHVISISNCNTWGYSQKFW